MNKVFLGLILAVCVLGMALVMLNDRLGRKSEPRPPVAEQTVKENRQPAETAVVYPNSISAPANTETINTLDHARSENFGAESAVPERAEKAEAEAPLSMPSEPVRASAETSPENQVIAPKPAAQETLPPPQAAAPTKIEEKPVPARTPEPVQAARAEEKPAPQVDKKPAQKPVPAEKNGPKTVTRFVVFARDKGATVRISGNAPIHYKSMPLDNPSRFVVDMDGDWQFPPSQGIPKNDLVSNVRVSRNGDKTRVVIDLKAKPRVSRIVANKQGDNIDIRVDK